MSTELKKVDQFEAVSPDGEAVLVLEFATFTTQQALSGVRETMRGLSSFRLASGHAVNRVSETEFEVVATGQRLRRR